MRIPDWDCGSSADCGLPTANRPDEHLRVRTPQSARRNPQCREAMNVDFIAAGSPHVVSRAIEEYARAQGHVTALVVPWESDATTLSMAVTSVKSDGWAIEHTNIGTITLTQAGPGTTRVAIAPHEPQREEAGRLSALFDRFAHQ